MCQWLETVLPNIRLLIHPATVCNRTLQKTQIQPLYPPLSFNLWFVRACTPSRSGGACLYQQQLWCACAGCNGPANHALGCCVHLHLLVVWEARVLPVQPRPGQVHAHFGAPCSCQLGHFFERLQALAVCVPAKSNLLAFLLCTVTIYFHDIRSAQCPRDKSSVPSPCLHFCVAEHGLWGSCLCQHGIFSGCITCPKWPQRMAGACAGMTSSQSAPALKNLKAVWHRPWPQTPCVSLDCYERPMCRTAL